MKFKFLAVCLIICLLFAGCANKPEFADEIGGYPYFSGDIEDYNRVIPDTTENEKAEWERLVQPCYIYGTIRDAIITPGTQDSFEGAYVSFIIEVTDFSKNPFTIQSMFFGILLDEDEFDFSAYKDKEIMLLGNMLGKMLESEDYPYFYGEDVYFDGVWYSNFGFLLNSLGDAKK